MGLHVGTSGWAYPEWRPAFYPAGLPQRAFLANYASRLTACEVNATFYRLQPETAVARWAEETPPGFRFAVKAHRRLTHGRSLPPGDGGAEFLERFLDGIAPLGDRLGAVLIQLPPSRARDDAALGALLGCLPRGLPFAIEFRHESWSDPAVRERVADAGGTVCVSETEGRVLPGLPPGPLAYVRLRGDRYPEAARAAWAGLLAEEAARRPVFAFAKHEGVPPDDPACGVGLALGLTSPPGRPPSPPPPAAG